jgi:hypothetical protein
MNNTKSGGLATAIIALSSCAPVAWGEPEPLALADGWRPLAEEDPFGEPPEEAWCDDLGWGPEDFAGEESLNVRSASCPWLTVQQATVAGLEVTDRLFLRLWHDMLVSPEQGKAARIGLVLESEVVFEQIVPIPSPSGIILADLSLRREVATGTPIFFHVDNHGANSYHLMEVSRRPPVPLSEAVDMGVPP